MFRASWARFVVAVAVSTVAACNGGGGGNGGGDGDGGGGTTGGGAGYVHVSSISPDHGPLPGGNIVQVTGSGFIAGNAAPNMMLVGGRLATSVNVISDTLAEVTVPPGMDAGSVSVTLFNNNGFIEVPDAYAYNPEPTISSIDPDAGDYKGGDTVTITGTGFSNLEPGTNRVWIDGVEAAVASVDSDTKLTVSTPPGVPLRLVDVSVSNDNGSADLPQSFHFTSDGILAFGNGPPPDDGSIYLVDPSDGTATMLVQGGGYGVVSAVLLADDSLLMGTAQGVLIHRTLSGEVTTRAVTGCQYGRIQSIVPFNSKLYAVCRQNPQNTQFGILDPATGEFTPVGGGTDAWNSGSLVVNGTTMYFVRLNQVFVLDPNNGTRTLLSTLDTTSVRPRGAIFVGGVAYMIDLGNGGGAGGGSGSAFIRRFDPGTGVTSYVTFLPARLHGLTPVP